jgi:hypothetical protein
MFRPGCYLPFQFRQRPATLLYVGFVITQTYADTAYFIRRAVNANEALSGDSDIYRGGPADIEKFEYPQQLVPTYSASFEPGPHFPPPAQWYTSRVSRFLNRRTPPFEIPRLHHAAHKLTRNDSSASSQRNLIRSASVFSDKSVASLNQDSAHTRNDSQEKRWMIE